MAKKLKKIKVTELWSVAKDIAKKNFQEDVKQDLKDFKDDKEELAEIKERVKTFDQLYKSFSQGLTKLLKAVEDEKDPGKTLRKAGEALLVVKDYEKALDKCQGGKIGNPKRVYLVLSGGLAKVKKELEACVEWLTNVLAEAEG